MPMIPRGSGQRGWRHIGLDKEVTAHSDMESSIRFGVKLFPLREAQTSRIAWTTLIPKAGNRQGFARQSSTILIIRRRNSSLLAYAVPAYSP